MSNRLRLEGRAGTCAMADQSAGANFECADEELADVLLVSGPSGAGKSTFIHLLTVGRLPDGLLSLLPDEVEDWPVVEANDCLKRGVTVESLRTRASASGGLILHYDTAFIFRKGLRGYQQDPVFKVLSEAKSLVIVSLNPSPEVLRAQFEDRRRLQMRNKGWFRQAWSMSVHRPLRHMRLKLRGRTFVDTADLYKEPRQINKCYREWDAFARSVVHAKPNSKLLYVVPQQSPGLHRSYTMIGRIEHAQQERQDRSRDLSNLPAGLPGT